MGFLSFSICFRYINKKITNITFLCFPLLRVSPYFSFSFIVFFSFHSFKHWRTVNIHVNMPCKLLSPPVLVDSTRFSLYAITEVSRKPKHALLTLDFKTYTFCARFSQDQILAPLTGMETVWFHVFVNFSSLFFWCAGQLFSIAEVHTFSCVVG